MKKWLITLLFTPTLLLAQEATQWANLGGTNYNQYSIQNNSLKISGKFLSMKSQNLDNGQTYLMNSFTTIEACKDKQGLLSLYTLDNRLIGQSIYVWGNKDPYSLIGTAMCSSYEEYLEQEKNKPLKTEELWQEIAMNSKSEVALKSNSFIKKQIKGKDFIGVTGRNIDNNSKKVMLVKWFVQVEDCKKQQGQLVTVNIDGSDMYENGFVLGSGSMGSIVAEELCKVK